MNLLLVVVAGVLCATGTYLLLGRQLSRIVIGVGLFGHGVNILFIVGAGDGGNPAFVGSNDPSTFADPLPQALVLTAIVITFGVVAFLLALAFRSWQVRANDEVEDDVEDRRIARAASRPNPEAERI